jgi:hypothetical protein
MTHADSQSEVPTQGGIIMRRAIIAIMAALMIVALAVPALAVSDQTPVGFGELFYEGDVVRTLVPPAASPQEGRDNLYAFTMGGAEGQRAIAAVAPGDPGYHGGQWAFHAVTWNTDPYLITSEADVLAAESAGDVTIMRVADNDFKCPIQPGGHR